eukprot:NODE_1378_length_985_cov_66.962607_g1061_i0.p1 GENE.NODE_1378_length_985_cov_66.962607_g1061_i0~~NODE_1378_length_985_cov_66.962607_g1061_i0.p1  ORF type:complete len:97 (-),score=8.85 NODE_1378_length_985_cov_66.962607_g1061_i0:258-548(-)
MPHHHDWHHEGHKSCNFTFSSLGGLWDGLFGTRNVGRADQLCHRQATAHDAALAGRKTPVGRGFFDRPYNALLPVLMVGVAVAFKLQAHGGAIVQY